MPATLARVVRRCLNTLTVPASDADLLRAFHRHRDSAAFAELIARHGPFVLGVARRVLGRSAEVDDVFQATFFTLARNARSVRDPGRLPGWLHRVALRTARRALARRRPTLPMESAAAVGVPAEPRDLSWCEGLQILDDELNALPDRLRSPLVLCYLDGLTRDEAASRLGYSLAKLKRRLEEGRGRLRVRLVRRGVSAALLGLVSTSELRAVVPSDLATATACLPFGPVPKTVTLLMPTGSSLGWKLAVAIGAMGILLGVVLQQVPTGGLQAPAKSPPVQVAPALLEVEPKLEAPLPTGAIARIGSTRFRHNNGSNNSYLSKDGRLLATTGKTTIAVWDTATGERRHLLRNCGIADGFASNHQRVAISPDNTLLANLSEYDFHVRVWDLKTGQQIYGIDPQVVKNPLGEAAPAPRPRDESSRERILMFSEAGTELLLVGGKGARRFEATTGKWVGNFDWTAAPLAVSADGRWCLINTEQNNPTGPREFAIVDMRDGKIGKSIGAGVGKVSGNVTLSADGKRFAVIETDVKVSVYDVATGKELFSFEVGPGGRERNLTMPGFSADGKSVFVGTVSGAVHRFDLDAKVELPQLVGHLWWATGVHAMPDGKTLISAGWDGMIRRYDLVAGKEIPAPPGYVRNLAIAVSPDRLTVAVADFGGRLDIFDSGGKPLRSIDTEATSLGRIAYSPDGKTLAAITRDGGLRIWDCATWAVVARVPSPRPGASDWVSVFQYTPDGRQILITSRENSLRCVDAKTLKEVWSLATKDLSAAAYSPDGRVLVTGGWDNQLTWRDPATGRPGRVVPTRDVVDAIDFAPDGRTLVSGGHDGSVRLWEAGSGKALGEWIGHGGAVWFTRFSPDGKWVASGAVDESVRVWDAATGKELAKYVGHDAWVLAGVWLGSRRIVTVTSGEGLVWDLKPRTAAFAEPDALWAALADDPVKAYQALWNFLADSTAAAKYLRSKIAPEKPPGDEKQIQNWLTDLDSDEFRVRERATKELRALGRPGLPYLRTGRPRAKAEGEQRIATLIADLDKGPTPEELRRSRAVQVLELAGTKEAQAVLKEWATGLPGAILTEEAAAAGRRFRD